MRWWAWFIAGLVFPVALWAFDDISSSGGWTGTATKDLDMASYNITSAGSIDADDLAVDALVVDGTTFTPNEQITDLDLNYHDLTNVGGITGDHVIATGYWSFSNPLGSTNRASSFYDSTCASYTYAAGAHEGLVDSGMLGWWKFDGTTQDLSRGYGLTVTGATWSGDDGLVFAGTAGHSALAQIGSLSDPYTITIAYKISTAVTNGWLLGSSTGSSSYVSQNGLNLTFLAGDTITIDMSTDSISQGDNVIVTLIVDGASGRVLVNNQISGYHQIGTGGIATGLYWGRRAGVTDGPFTGTIYSTVVYDRALNECEARQNHNALRYQLHNRGVELPPEYNIYILGDSKNLTATGYPAALVTLLQNVGVPAQLRPANDSRSGETVAFLQAAIDYFVSVAKGIPTVVLIGIGANDAYSLPNEATWKTNYKYIIDALLVKWPNTHIYLSKPWRGKTYKNSTNSLAGWIDDIAADYPGQVFAGADERSFLSLSGSCGYEGCTYMNADLLHLTTSAYTGILPQRWVSALGY